MKNKIHNISDIAPNTLDKLNKAMKMVKCVETRRYVSLTVLFFFVGTTNNVVK